MILEFPRVETTPPGTAEDTNTMKMFYTIKDVNYYSKRKCMSSAVGFS